MRLPQLRERATNRRLILAHAWIEVGKHSNQQIVVTKVQLLAQVLRLTCQSLLIYAVYNHLKRGRCVDTTFCFQEFPGVVANNNVCVKPWREKPNYRLIFPILKPARVGKHQLCVDTAGCEVGVESLYGLLNMNNLDLLLFDYSSQVGNKAQIERKSALQPNVIET
jgi:hypothetical protein